MVDTMYFPTPWLVLTNWILEDSMLWSLKYAYIARLVVLHSCIAVWEEYALNMNYSAKKKRCMEIWTQPIDWSQVPLSLAEQPNFIDLQNVIER